MKVCNDPESRRNRYSLFFFFFFLVTIPLQLNPVVVFKILDVLVVSAWSPFFGISKHMQILPGCCIEIKCRP